MVDAMSTDGTRELLAGLSARYPFVRVVDNPAGVTPVALNLGIRAARGTVIVRIDGHATIQPGYLVKCVTALRAGKANNVGGVMQIVPKTLRFSVELWRHVWVIRSGPVDRVTALEAAIRCWWTPCKAGATTGRYSRK